MRRLLSLLIVSVVTIGPAAAAGNAQKYDTATFATGCFWCTQATFQQLRGVVSVTAGFSGGHTKNPTYHEVCTGTTGHAESCNIVYDPKKITYDDLLEAFFKVHDPTQLNRQGNDVGTQYRSAIFYHNATQKKKAEYYIQKINEAKAYPNPVVTEVVPYTVFYKAEDYHQDYYNKNGDVPYCKYVIQPEVEKFKKIFADKLKTP
ncbi:MAG TPA: peptide-methionine (S)-S-oxide reductase MsrA [Dinghuibacter sp.]|uniref:peptide-methionine (S)-S-oxide reductase MsrA n=1 Tax=Dinghuibacter sp. TaxID=2024697 RepID=UPI002CC09145|nr:peptide-methionine (S)-S-oxide reductase MsrA [Dinghuibacter sp.]HTJ11948.1 peptide-methionine (S)-S-oxide reductase MsrA [Dinghuibacter sp.]